ncbi:MAG TPA: TetR/AcrR family transcriptional regulator [Verrucomicrobiae bacterium]|jgi:AcrR family transcriptional regulator
MGKAVIPKSSDKTRAEILRAALKRFANAGYAATSVQQIAVDAKVSKPALYYHFRDKSDLFTALVNEAVDERYDLMQKAAASAKDIRSQLVAVMSALFDYFHKNHDLTRLAFLSAFAAPGEMPHGRDNLDKCQRNFNAIHSLFRQAVARRELDDRFGAEELAYGFYGLGHFYIVSQLKMPHYRLDRRAAARIVDLFLAGAAKKPKIKQANKSKK